MATGPRKRPIRSFFRALLPFVVILVATASFTWASRMSHSRRNRSLKERERELQAENGRLERDVRLMQLRVDGMESDPYVVESHVRERGYLRPGEVLVRPDERD